MRKLSNQEIHQVAGGFAETSIVSFFMMDGLLKENYDPAVALGISVAAGFITGIPASLHDLTAGQKMNMPLRLLSAILAASSSYGLRLILAEQQIPAVCSLLQETRE